MHPAQAEIERGYVEHAKRLTTYTKTALQITFSLIVAFYTAILGKKESKIFILLSFISLLLALFFELVLLVLIGCIGSANRNCFYCGYKEHMYFCIYGSNFLLMLTAFFLLVLCSLKYALLALFLILAVVVISILLYRGFKLKHIKHIGSYGNHDNELNRSSELSSAVVIMLFSGLSSFVFTSATVSGEKNQIKATECLLFVVLVISLLLMLLTSVPPAVQHPSTRDIMVGVVKSLSYTLVSLLTLVGLMAASEILEGIAVFVIFAHLIGATYWLVTELLYENANQLIDRVQRASEANQDNHSGEPVMEKLDSLSMVSGAGTFLTLMYVYSKNIDNSNPHSQWDHYLMVVCMISLCSTLISCLSKMVIFSSSQKKRYLDKGVTILSFIFYISAFVAVLSTFLFTVYSDF